MGWEYLAQGGANLLGAGLSYITSSNLGYDARSHAHTLNEIAANNADKRTRALHRDMYSISAQMKDAKDAGLSPSLFYQGQGTIGQSGAMGAGAGGIGNPYTPVSPIDVAGIELAKAQKDKTKAETENIQEDTITKKLDNYINSTIADESIEQAKLTTQVMAANLQQTIESTKNIQWQTDFNKLTQNEQVKALVNKNNLILSEIVLNQSNAKLNDREREHYDTIFQKWQMDSYQKFVELDIYEQSVENQDEWFENQTLQLKNELEFEKDKTNKTIKLNKTSMWLNFGTDILKTTVYGFGLYASGGLSGILGTKPQPIGFR